MDQVQRAFLDDYLYRGDLTAGVVYADWLEDEGAARPMEWKGRAWTGDAEQACQGLLAWAALVLRGKLAGELPRLCSNLWERKGSLQHLRMWCEMVADWALGHDAATRMSRWHGDNVKGRSRRHLGFGVSRLDRPWVGVVAYQTLVWGDAPFSLLWGLREDRFVSVDVDDGGCWVAWHAAPGGRCDLLRLLSAWPRFEPLE
jgi:hypothetical protein